jgi:hypothetical protein
MKAETQANDATPREQTAQVCDQIRDKLNLEENKGSATLTQTEKRRILNELED